MPMKCLLRIFAIFPVVPLPINGSNTVSHSLLHEMMWSLASDSGNGAGCFEAKTSLEPPPANIFHTFLFNRVLSLLEYQ